MDPERAARIAVVGLGLLVVLTVGVGASTSSTSFSAYNSAWDGASGLQTVASDSGASFTVATDLETAYREPDGTIAIVLSPDRVYAENEAERVRQFVERGGTLVVADDFGPHANPLLAAVGSEVRVDGRLLRDERRYDRTPNFTESTTTANATFLDDERTLVLNYGSALRSTNGSVLARSSEFSYLDRNQNYELDDDEELRSHTVATRESIGNGTVVVLSDPSMFINSMADQGDNRAFVAGLVDAHENVVVDYSHTESVPPLVSLMLWLRRTPIAQAILGAGGLTIIGLAASRPRLLSDILEGKQTDDSSKTDTETLKTYLAARHPEWDEAELDKIMRGVKTNDTEVTGDD